MEKQGITEINQTKCEISNITDLKEKEQLNKATAVSTVNTKLTTMIATDNLHYIGGLDISYPTWDETLSCGCLVVYDCKENVLCYKNVITERSSVPYIAGFLAYRERDIYRHLLNELKQKHPELWPDVLLVDGQGRLHPRHFGSACEIGVEWMCPTIGIGKNMFCGLDFVIPNKEYTAKNGECNVCWTIKECKNVFEHNRQLGQTTTPIVHYGDVIAIAFCLPAHSKPIFISIGNLISLEQAVHIVETLCKYRIPEPIRFADHISREYLSNLK